MTRSVATGVLLALTLSGSRSGAQEWRETAGHLGTTARVLVIGTRPEDEDNALIAWLSLGRNVETAYLSLTRGENGVNLAGAERQAPLAVLRTAELLAERQRDRAHQYFTRAYDFGSTALDSIVDASWPRDSLLRDVVSVVRAFRPHVVISLVAEAGERDATHRLTARLAAEAFSAAADSVRLPSAATSRLPAWTIARLFTRVDSGPSAEARVVAVDVGEFDRGAGRSYAEIGADIRQLQRSQPALPAPELGRLWRSLRLDSTRVGERDGSLFGALDTTLSRWHSDLPSEAHAQLDSLRSDIDDVQTMSRRGAADSLAVRLARVASRTSSVRRAMACRDVDAVPACPGALGDLAVALNTIRERATRAMIGAAGIVIDATVRELVAAGDSVSVIASVYNGGATPVTIRRLAASWRSVVSVMVRDESVVVLADSAMVRSTNVRVLSPSYHWWQINGLVSGTLIHDFRTTPRNPVVPQLIGGEDQIATSRVEATVVIGGVEVPVIVRPLVYRSATAMRGDARHPLAGVPATSVLLERTAEYERAGQPIDRLFRVYVWSARSTPDTLAVTLRLPSGLTADSAVRTVVLAPFGTRNVFFRLRGVLRAGSDTISATARSVASAASGQSQTIVRTGSPAAFGLGVVTHDYPHVPSQQFVRFASDRIESVDVRIPPRLRVAYVKGTDDVQTPLGQLQVKVQVLEPSLLAVVDLSGFTTVLIGADAMANDALADAVPALHKFLGTGGAVVVLPGRDEVGRSGLFPYPIAFDGVLGRVKDPGAAVDVSDARAQLLNWPNVITARDFEGWTGDRARSVPSAFDPRYRTLLSMGDAGQKPTTATILAARMGKGTIVYSSLSIDQQLAEINAGAARLMINLLAAGLSPEKPR